MTNNIVLSADPTKRKLIKALGKIRKLKIIKPNSQLSAEKQYKKYKKHEMNLKVELLRVAKYIATLERINEKWLESLQKLPFIERDEENQCCND